MAIWEEVDRNLTYPFGIQTVQELEYIELFKQSVESAETIDKQIYSFDIDLTLMMPEDNDYIHGVIPIDNLIKLQLLGNIVGTCSDREPSNQWRSMLYLNFIPDFCLPKEMLGMLKSLMPGAKLLHIGDDPIRDEEQAIIQGWEFDYPADFLRRNLV